MNNHKTLLRKCKHLQGLLFLNRRELDDYAEQQEMFKQIRQEEKDKKRLDEWAVRCHHRKSTFAQPSIYNSPFLP